MRALVHDGSQFADRVGLAAYYYHEGEQYISNTFKVVTNAALGNPNLTEEEIEAQSWGKTLSDNPSSGTPTTAPVPSGRPLTTPPRPGRRPPLT
ncbi:hypothetical protein ACFQ2B_11400 [Streptomyces stramineus]